VYCPYYCVRCTAVVKNDNVIEASDSLSFKKLNVFEKVSSETLEAFGE